MFFNFYKKNIKNVFYIYASPLLPYLPLSLEVGPLIAARGLGERFSSPSGSGRSPTAERYLVNFRLKISPLVAKNSKNIFVAEKVVRPWPDRPDRRLRPWRDWQRR